MTNDELTQHMRELLAERIKKTLTRGSAETASLILQGNHNVIVLPEEATDAMIAARNEALEQALKAVENSTWGEGEPEEYQVASMHIDAIRGLKVQS